MFFGVNLYALLNILFISLLHCFSVISGYNYYVHPNVFIMRRSTSALIVVLLFLFSCTKESVTPESESGDDYLKRGKAITKTLKIHESSGIILNYVPCETCDFCEEGAVLFVQGTGHATHLGAFTVINYFCLEALGIIRGELTAANGDKIFTMVTKEPYVDDRGLVYYYSILDGTGRFEGAKGHIEMWGLIDYDNGIFDLQGLGEITY